MSVPAQQRKSWRALVLLAPLAAVLGLLLAHRHSTVSKIGFTLTNDEVVRIARAQATAKNIVTNDWRVLLDVKSNNDLRHYLQLSATAAERTAIERAIAPVVYRCALENPTRAADSVRVTVSPDGRLLSYDTPPTARNAPPVGEKFARLAAERELLAQLGTERPGFNFKGVGSEPHEPTASIVRRFTFRRDYSRDLALEATVELSGLQPIGFSVAPRIAPAYLKRHAELALPLKMTRGFAIGLLVILGVVYVIARFVKRMREQEIPLKRAAIVAAFVFIAFAVSMLSGMQGGRIDALVKGDVTGRSLDLVLVLFVSSVMAAFLGLTWGACEADVREAYPEKLTSTDALLGGVFSSRALRTSLALGLTFGAWAILLTGLDALLRQRMGGWAAIADGELLAYQSNWPGLVVVLFAFTGLPMLMGMLMASVSVTHRRGSTRNARLAFVLLVFFFFLLGALGTQSPLALSLVQAAIAAAVMVIPFLAGDVLAVVVATAVSAWAVASVTLIAQPGTTFRISGWTMLAVLALLIAGGMAAALRKREETAEVERPEYARNIAERLLLVTEMDAARQAQLRVMPRVVPVVAGTRLAARHSASAEIGSDYYEFFPAADHVSVAVADARLPGLSSALCVSMLKGLLLNYAARLTNPRDIADRVYRQLAAIFGEDLPVSFFFGRLDRATGGFTFATFGDAPHAVLIHRGATSLEGEEFAELRDAASDAIVVYTARLAEMRDRDGAALGDDALLRELEGVAGGEPQRLVDALFELASRQSRGVDAPQSWTAVALALAIEGARA